MPQTIGAFLALASVMMFSLNYQQSAVRRSMSAVNSEMEVMGNAVASEAMQYIASKPFDSRTADKTVTILNPISSLLTPAISFGFAGKFADCKDVDDFHNMQPDTVWFETAPGEGFDFTVNASVRYIDENGYESHVPTWIKEVTVSVEGPDYGGRKLLFSPIKITRQFSPQWN